MEWQYEESCPSLSKDCDLLPPLYLTSSAVHDGCRSGAIVKQASYPLMVTSGERLLTLLWCTDRSDYRPVTTENIELAEEASER